MVALTISLAASAIAMVVFGAALSLLLLDYGGTELLGWFSRGRRSGSTDASVVGSVAGTWTRAESDHGTLGAVLTPHGSAARGMELLRVGIGVVWAATLVVLLLPSTGYWSDLVASSSVLLAGTAALVMAYLAAAFLVGVTTRFACVVGAVLSVAFVVTQSGTAFGSFGGAGVGPQLLYLAVYAALWVGGAGRLWSVDGSLWKRGWGHRVPQARWFASLPPTGTA